MPTSPPAAARWPLSSFAYGAAMYPEYLPRATWLRMLDQLAGAHGNLVRLLDSAWGHMEPAPGQYQFDLLAQWIDDCAARGLSCLIGTGSYIAPQWLFAQHPGVTPQPQPGAIIDSIGRRNACLHQPAFRAAVQRYVTALATAVGRRAGVVGWQVDNEIDALLHAYCYCPACEQAWAAWLERRFATADRANDELGLRYWGFQVDRLADIRLPRVVGLYNGHPVLKLTERFFRRDMVLEFLAEQARILRDHQVTGWIVHDFASRTELSSDSLTEEDIFDLRGNNLYVEGVNVAGAVEANVAATDAAAFWGSWALACEHLRTVHGQNAFLCLETSCGAIGGTVFPRTYTTPAQQRFNQLFLTAHGANGMLYWSGNSWHGGPWPVWRSMFDYEGEPESDFARFTAMGALFARWGATLLAHPPLAEAAFVHDLENKLYADHFPVHPMRASKFALASVPGSLATPKDFFSAATEPFRQLGWGINGLSSRRLRDAATLRKYQLIVLIGNACLDDPRQAQGLQAYVEQGGTLVIGPLVNYLEPSGVFRRRGLGGNLERLGGARVKSYRLFGPIDHTRQPHARLGWDDAAGVFTGESELFSGLCETLKVGQHAEVIGRLRSADPSVHDAPAALRVRHGAGTVYRFAAWPEDWRRLLPRLGQPTVPFLAAPLPAGVQSVPRTDGSLFVLNGLSVPTTVHLIPGLRDRLTGQPLAAAQTIPPLDVLWVERGGA